MELYDAGAERRHEQLRAMGMMVGAEIPAYNDDEENEFTTAKPLKNSADIGALPISLGYEFNG